jgi:hypothetical protein
MSELLAVATILVRAEEAWEPVLLGGMIPILGALAIFGLIYRAVRDNPENDPPEDSEDVDEDDSGRDEPPA